MATEDHFQPEAAPSDRLQELERENAHLRKKLFHTEDALMTTTTCLRDADAVRLKSEEDL